jgi:hypothetical protein
MNKPRMKWYEPITESPLFKRIVDPSTKLGAVIVAVIAFVFSIVAVIQNPNMERNCQTNPLRDVYNPKRLKVLGTCQTIIVTVVESSKERDGDLHIRAVADKRWLSPMNTTRQHGDLVVEYMPGDAWPRPKTGDKLRLTCTWVSDLQHGGWNECHPVWSVQPILATARRVEP